MVRTILQETGEISVVGIIVEICSRKTGEVASVVSADLLENVEQVCRDGTE